MNRPGYNNSRLKLMVNPGFSFLPGVQFDILLNRSNGIKANCGTPGDYQGIKIKIHVAPDPAYPRASKGVEEVISRGLVIQRHALRVQLVVVTHISPPPPLAH